MAVFMHDCRRHHFLNIFLWRLFHPAVAVFPFTINGYMVEVSNVLYLNNIYVELKITRFNNHKPSISLPWTILVPLHRFQKVHDYIHVGLVYLFRGHYGLYLVSWYRVQYKDTYYSTMHSTLLRNILSYWI